MILYTNIYNWHFSCLFIAKNNNDGEKNEII